MIRDLNESDIELLAKAASEVEADVIFKSRLQAEFKYRGATLSNEAEGATAFLFVYAKMLQDARAGKDEAAKIDNRDQFVRQLEFISQDTQLSQSTTLRTALRDKVMLTDQAQLDSALERLFAPQP